MTFKAPEAVKLPMSFPAGAALHGVGAEINGSDFLFPPLYIVSDFRPNITAATKCSNFLCTAISRFRFPLYCNIEVLISFQK